MEDKIIKRRFNLLDTISQWNWGKFFNSMEKPVVACGVAYLAFLQTENPQLAEVVGLAGAALYAALKFFASQYKKPA